MFFYLQECENMWWPHIVQTTYEKQQHDVQSHKMPVMWLMKMRKEQIGHAYPGRVVVILIYFVLNRAVACCEQLFTHRLVIGSSYCLLVLQKALHDPSRSHVLYLVLIQITMRQIAKLPSLLHPLVLVPPRLTTRGYTLTIVLYACMYY